MIGASSPLFSVWPFEEALEALEPHFELWEIVSEADHFIPDIYDKLKNVMETSTMKFQIHAPYSDINLAAFDQKTRDYSIGIIEEIVRLANELGIDMVTIHPGNIAPIQSYDKPRVPKFTRQSLELLEKGLIKTEPLMSGIISLEQLGESLNNFSKPDRMKTLIRI